MCTIHTHSLFPSRDIAKCYGKNQSSYMLKVSHVIFLFFCEGKKRRNFFIFSSYTNLKVCHFDVQFSKFLMVHHRLREKPNDKELFASKSEKSSEEKSLCFSRNGYYFLIFKPAALNFFFVYWGWWS